MPINVLYTARNFHKEACDLLSKKNYKLFTIDPYSPAEVIIDVVKKENIEAIITSKQNYKRSIY